MYDYVKISIILLLGITLSACMNFSLPEGISSKGEQVGQDHNQSEQKNNIEQNEEQNEEQNIEQMDKDFLLESHYFNVVKEANGNKMIENPTNILAMVNKEYSLPESYEPADLVVPNVEFSFSDTDIPKRYLREEAAKALEELLALAEQDGAELLAVSGFRSYSRQQDLFNIEKEKKGEEKALQAVALPGKSEHQTGLAMDVTSRSVNLEITKEFGETKEGKWVKENAHKAGFIIRYPKGKEPITGYQYEPWHLRYVGKEKASVMYENDLTLEEYFQMVKKI
ncbi:peptidase M15 [Bacillus sp. SA1-12]|uniref:M15 family metallopeptidase n=1 Tax=Bacillus sp. SA1-12 TaxID=1455638 RepID=UPI000626FB0F|nr:M15 family metallopeptidase [Bacillus sp. SA1-12]KKI90572.1 peptidase M15 [Bacillus sp. SA1-12]